jgi:hypothetical protein
MNKAVAFNILYTNIVYPIFDISSRLVIGIYNRCKKPKIQNIKPSTPSIFESFMTGCQTGNTTLVEAYINHSETSDETLSKGFEVSILNKNIKCAKLLMNLGKNTPTKGLEIAVKNNDHNMAEMFLQNKADSKIGLRYSKSPNITRMIYRYEQKTDIII